MPVIVATSNPGKQQNVLVLAPSGGGTTTGGTTPGTPSGTGTSGTGGSPGSATGTYVYTCIAFPGTSVGFNQASWVTLPAPFDGLDVKVYWSSFFGEYDWSFRNRYQSSIHFSHDALPNAIPSRTTYRTDLGAGHDEGSTYREIMGWNGKQGACIRVDQVRIGADSGPYR
jgi:hypothetical protein